MRFKGFIGPSYQSAAVQVDAQRSINLYPELVAGDGGASEESVLIRTPGLAVFTVAGLPTAEGRGVFAVNGRLFAVIGTALLEVVADFAVPPHYTALNRGTIATSTGASNPVRIQTNGVQLLILGSGTCYCFTLATNVLQDLGFLGFNWSRAGLCVLDTYFVAVSANSNQFQISAPLNGMSWTAIDFGSTQEADNIVAIEELHGYLWIFGANSIVVFQDTGNASFPFQRVPGSKIEMGLGAALSLVKLDNSIFWLGLSTRGPAVVYRADGFLPARVSTHALEAAMQGYTTTSDAIASTYEERGHLFYRLDFPTAGATWVYDVSTKAWHERAYWNTGTGSYTIHPARYHAFCFGLHLVLHYATGAIYEQSLKYYDDAGNPLRWLRRAPHITDNDGRRKLFYGRFELIMNTGFDLPPGSNPLIFLRWSNDGGVTWSSDHGAAASAGTTGQYARRILWRQLGGSRSRVFEVSGSDALPDLVLIGAELRLERGIS